VRRFPAEQAAFGGRRGYDFELYGPPEGCAAAEAADVRLDAPEAAAFLGPEWERNGDRGPGLALPQRGAALFLPPLAGTEVQVEFEVIGDRPASGAPPILVKVHKAPLALTEAAPKRAGTRLLLAALRTASPSRVTELRLAPASSNVDVRITRFRFSRGADRGTAVPPAYVGEGRRGGDD
jgi:hypothetical protein